MKELSSTKKKRPRLRRGSEKKGGVLREMSLDSAGERLVPDRAQRQLMIAQAHIAERDGAFEDKAEEAEVLGK